MVDAAETQTLHARAVSKAEIEWNMFRLAAIFDASSSAYLDESARTQGICRSPC